MTEESPVALNTFKKFVLEAEEAFAALISEQLQVLELMSLIQRREAEFDDPMERLRSLVRKTNPTLDNEKHGELWSLAEEYLNVRLAVSEGSETIPENVKANADEQLEKLISKGPWAYPIVRCLAEVLATKPSQARLFSSLLVSSVADYETYIGSILNALVRCHPKSTYDNNKKFTLGELFAKGNFDALLDEVSAQWVSSLMRGGQKGWASELEVTFNVKSYIDKDHSDRIREAFECRHAFVHNGGRATEEYRKLATGIDISSGRIVIDGPYLGRLLDELLLSALTITGWAMSKMEDIHKDEGFSPEPSLVDSVYRLVRAGRFAVVIRYVPTLPMSDLKLASSSIMRVNYWLSIKSREGLAGNDLEEVRNWDTMALDTRFKLARLALLNENEQALNLAYKMLARGELTLAYWLEWPLLEGVREHALNEGKEPWSFAERPSGSPRKAAVPGDRLREGRDRRYAARRRKRVTASNISGRPSRRPPRKRKQ